jgi:hypothetical protein
MKVMLDTHTFLWFVLDDPQLSTSAKTLIELPFRNSRLCFLGVFLGRQVGRFIGRKFQDSAQASQGSSVVGQSVLLP